MWRKGAECLPRGDLEPVRSEPDRRRRLQTWVHTYNLHRHHTAIGDTPASRVNNLCGHYT